MFNNDMAFILIIMPSAWTLVLWFLCTLARISENAMIKTTLV